MKIYLVGGKILEGTPEELHRYEGLKDTLYVTSAKINAHSLTMDKIANISAGSANFHDVGITNVKINHKEDPLLKIEMKDIDSIPTVIYKGKEITGMARASIDWKTKDERGLTPTYIHIDHYDKGSEGMNSKIIQHNDPIKDYENDSFTHEGYENIYSVDIPNLKPNQSVLNLVGYSTEELIEALEARENVESISIDEHVYDIKINPKEIKKYTLLKKINK